MSVCGAEQLGLALVLQVGMAVEDVRSSVLEHSSVLSPGPCPVTAPSPPLPTPTPVIAPDPPLVLTPGTLFAPRPTLPTPAPVIALSPHLPTPAPLAASSLPHIPPRLLPRLAHGVPLVQPPLSLRTPLARALLPRDVHPVCPRPRILRAPFPLRSGTRPLRQLQPGMGARGRARQRRRLLGKRSGSRDAPPVLEAAGREDVGEAAGAVRHAVAQCCARIRGRRGAGGGGPRDAPPAVLHAAGTDRHRREDVAAAAGGDRFLCAGRSGSWDQAYGGGEWRQR
ncbi:hypothetical protein BDK51DRAFT_49023 [Blyttiomyces helicus]|uniref:Uncharacterized protein n=1 Tax=Blyttiomyces helicus TaxID=388810 RepID=A0A4P9WFG5_9FUNG|nr:hypothetical protein BDK51DRAFT_49023 [Blyttiomyces helicus]|eukprot:RKO90595.1 hypothetical protein BDK51DRAFT_49023 [Blyttiomyces helicus]